MHMQNMVAVFTTVMYTYTYCCNIILSWLSSQVASKLLLDGFASIAKSTIVFLLKNGIY